jgi:hypothetical protein
VKKTLRSVNLPIVGADPCVCPNLGGHVGPPLQQRWGWYGAKRGSREKPFSKKGLPRLLFCLRSLRLCGETALCNPFFLDTGSWLMLKEC